MQHGLVAHILALDQGVLIYSLSAETVANLKSAIRKQCLNKIVLPQEEKSTCGETGI